MDSIEAANAAAVPNTTNGRTHAELQVEPFGEFLRVHADGHGVGFRPFAPFTEKGFRGHEVLLVLVIRNREVAPLLEPFGQCILVQQVGRRGFRDASRRL